MEEARRVLARLERIERLRVASAEPKSLLEEVRLLLEEGEEWISAERAVGDPALSALDRLASSLESTPPPRAA